MEMCGEYWNKLIARSEDGGEIRRVCFFECFGGFRKPAVAPWGVSGMFAAKRDACRSREQVGKGGQADGGSAGESGARILAGSFDTSRRSWAATSMVLIRYRPSCSTARIMCAQG